MAQSALRSRWVMANGVRTHYTEAGAAGPVILALHGGGAGSSGEAGMGLVMPYLAEDFWVLAPDLVGGYGKTDASAPTPYGLINRVSHIEDFVDALCLDKFTIMGNSQGAWAAVRYAMLHPDKVDKVICVSSVTIAQGMGVEQGPTPAMKALLEYDGTREGMKKLLEALIVDKSRITDALIDRRQEAAARPGAVAAAEAFAKATGALRGNALLQMQMDLRQSLPLLTKTKPTIFLWGEQDTFGLPETGRKVEALLPEVKFHWIPGAGHQVQTDKPAESAKIIRDFVLG